MMYTVFMNAWLWLKIIFFQGLYIVNTNESKMIGNASIQNRKIMDFRYTITEVEREANYNYYIIIT